MAEGFLRQLLGPDTSIGSAGTETVDGLPPTDDAVLAMRELGLEIGGHRSRDVNLLSLQGYDLIIAMTPRIGSELRSKGVDGSRLVELNVPDPYGNGIDAYRTAAAEIKTQLRRLLGMEDSA
jgi:protein-tyrosine phosphatase